jgi:hypothetical protein
VLSRDLLRISSLEDQKSSTLFTPWRRPSKAGVIPNLGYGFGSGHLHFSVSARQSADREIEEGRMQERFGVRTNVIARVCIIAAASWAMSLPEVSQAQLYDPNGQCVYQPGSTVCQPVRPVPPPQISRPVVNGCEADCNARQQQCMATCTAQHDWYRCFAYCGDGRTVCLRGCPM